jgi:hypothetical protein
VSFEVVPGNLPKLQFGQIDTLGCQFGSDLDHPFFVIVSGPVSFQFVAQVDATEAIILPYVLKC